MIRSSGVLNTTGPGTNVGLLVGENMLDGPIPGLLAQGLVTPHQAVGLRFDPETFESIDVNNKPVPGLHLLRHQDTHRERQVFSLFATFAKE